MEGVEKEESRGGGGGGGGIEGEERGGGGGVLSWRVGRVDCEGPAAVGCGGGEEDLLAEE